MSVLLLPHQLADIERLRQLDPAFFAKVAIVDECWIWTGSIGSDGYGAVTRRKVPGGSAGGRWLAHRYAHHLLRGPIQPGLIVDQSCGNRRCCNVDHVGPRRRNAVRSKPVERVSPPPTPQPTPCLVWRGTLSGDGYGFYRDQRLHRWIMSTAGVDQFGTPWDAALIVMHLCDNPPCFRYDHLRLGTNADNTADMIAKGRAGWQGAA